MPLEKLREFLGGEFSIVNIDTAPSLQRILNSEYGIEIFKADTYNLCVWKTTPIIQVCIYNEITDPQVLKDLVGYVSVKYQNLFSQIHVECEE